MPRFRVSTQFAGAENLTSPTVRVVLADVFRPAHFFFGNSFELKWSDWVREEIPWEVFNGRLLDPAHTRRRRTFESLQVHRVGSNGISAEPLLSIKYDLAANQIHITRAVECFIHEAYDAGDNVILTHEVRKWVRELVGTVELSQFIDAGELRDELIFRMFQAVVGTSRLPLTSVEAPLPDFSLGELAYCYRPNETTGDGPMRSYDDLLQKAWSTEIASLEQTKLLEILLRATPSAELENLAAVFLDKLRMLEMQRRLPALLRTIFNDVSLTPYTDFVPKTLEFLHRLVRRSGLTVEQHVDFLSYLLRQLGRHLTAYDLVIYHHRGANYPDALLLDAVLKEYIRLIEQFPELFLPLGQGESSSAQMRRRALRQAWYFRRHYEGHLVPDVPTSPGENMRCMPSPHPRIPEEQILDSTKRTRRLYDNDPIEAFLGNISHEVLRQSIQDLRDPVELRELGMAIFLDRPLGRWKRPGEPDQTPLFSYETFSRSIAWRRLRETSRFFEFGTLDVQAWEQSLDAATVDGAKVDAAPSRQLPGRVSITDASQVAGDFVLLRTTKRSARTFLDLFDWSPLSTAGFSILNIQVSLIVGSTTEPHISFFDDRACRRMDLSFDPKSAFRSRGGLEIPVDGLRVFRIFGSVGGNWREHAVDIAVLLMGTK